MADIEQAKKWCEEARKLLNWASLPWNDRWVMGNNIISVTEAITKLEGLAKSPGAKGKLAELVKEFKALGEEAEKATAKKDYEAIKKISVDLEKKAAEIDQTSSKIEQARDRFAGLKKKAEEQFDEFVKNIGGNLPKIRENLKQMIADAQTAFDQGHFSEAAKALEDYAGAVVKGKEDGAVVLIDMADKALKKTRTHEALTGVWKTACETLYRPDLTELEGQLQQARDQFDAGCFKAGRDMSFTVSGGCQALEGVLSRQVTNFNYYDKTLKDSQKLPVDSAMVKQAIKDGKIEDYAALLQEGRAKMDKRRFEAGWALVDKAASAIKLARTLSANEAAAGRDLKLLEEALKSPKSEMVRNSSPELTRQLELARKAYEGQDAAEAARLAGAALKRATQLAEIEANIMKDTGNVTALAEGDDIAESVKKLRAKWELLNKTYKTSIKVAKAEMDRADEKLKTVLQELTPPPKTEPVGSGSK